MNNALIGYSGFVGQTLLRQTTFKHLYRSTNIDEIRGGKFDTVICAGAPAQKWIANREPQADLAKIQTLMNHLGTIQCKKMVLISTVDVFLSAEGVDENTPVIEAGLHAYGLHRRMLETFVQDTFAQSLVVRLPGLVGPGLRKNVIFDFLNDNNLSAIDSRGIFQFYPMVNLWSDIQQCQRQELSLVHLTAEPISVHDVAAEGFGLAFDNPAHPIPARYDMRSIHAQALGGGEHHQYNKRETLFAIRAYAQSEPRTLPKAAP